jgi:hypothetical protein
MIIIIISLYYYYIIIIIIIINMIIIHPAACISNTVLFLSKTQRFHRIHTLKHFVLNNSTSIVNVRWRKNGENCITRSFVICTLRQV